MTNFPIGISNLIDIRDRQWEVYIGKVVDNTDSLGRIKCEIPELFEGLSTSDLPWISMLPSIGMYIKPELNEYVSVEFRGSVYEGFYQANAVNITDVGNLAATNLGESFIFNLHDTVITGKYDGSYLKIATTKFEIIDNNGQVSINHPQGILELSGNAVIPNSSGQGAFCCLPFDPLTGLPHVGKKVVP